MCIRKFPVNRDNQCFVAFYLTNPQFQSEIRWNYSSRIHAHLLWSTLLIGAQNCGYSSLELLFTRYKYNKAFAQSFLCLCGGYVLLKQWGTSQKHLKASQELHQHLTTTASDVAYLMALLLKNIKKSHNKRNTLKPAVTGCMILLYINT